METLGVAASVIAAIDISARVISLCSQYFNEVQDARGDIERLRAKVNSINVALENAQQFLDALEGNRLPAHRMLYQPLNDCHAQLRNVQDRLEPGKARRGRYRLGLRALKWPFKDKEMESVVSALEQCKSNIYNTLLIYET